MIRLTTLWPFTAFVFLTCPATARDVFLTIGGGYDPSGNQISLENNAIFLQQLLHEKFGDGVHHEIYFADGDDPAPDLQFIDDAQRKNCPAAARLMCEVLGSADSVGLCYRNHQVPSVKGPTELAVLRRRFRELGRELKAGDRLFVYVTGHGGPGEGENDSGNYDYEYDEEKRKWVATANQGEGSSNENEAFNTSFYLWDSEQVSAQDFNRWLDHISPDVTVVLVMVQCYAGGFADMIFHRHDPELGLAPHRRCGFFAQLHDRGAAGCTPEVNEADYQEYSTFFWAALGGKNRSGESIAKPDYDDDGQVSLAEAHAYTLIESDTIDIPVRTSEALLRRYSRLGREGRAKPDSQAKKPATGLFGLFGGKQEAISEGTHEPQSLLDATGPLANFLAKARPDQRAILVQLTKKLELAEPVTVEAIRLKLKQAQSHGSATTMKYSSASSTLDDCERELKNDVCAIWPELEERFSPLIAELTSTRAEEFTEKVKALPSYNAWIKAKARDQELTTELLQAQRVEARVQRLLRTIENIVYAENLAKCAPADIVARYHQLIEIEEQSLGTK
jgi:hypothetical protein